ncbi:MAG TPA: nickel pincer cofactor biosynthesis protein LarC [Verrucomicrobiae bacterium]|nr:nickel pincer cofactor biosynthesis protein LarC [Verrucomicrobiae bacterium]
MKLLYLDCFSGISGDMFLGALLDLGVSEDKLRGELTKLKLSGFTISTRRVVKQNVSATKFDVIEEPRHSAVRGTGATRSHRGYTEIVAMIEDSGLSDTVKRRALSLFKRVGEAEAKIHGIPLEKVHFHEVGAVDSIVDIVGASIAVDALGVDEIQASPPRLGSGFVDTAHGRLPVPVPATLELLRGIPTQGGSDPAELVTPTGAALLAEFCTTFGPLPPMSVEKIGYGAGSRDLERAPNVLRAVVGEASIRLRPAGRDYDGQESEETDTIGVIETNIDDMNPQLFGDVLERVLAAGALDAFLTPVQMKKNRPGTLLTVLCERNDVDRLAELLLTHTTSFGVRTHEAQRRKLSREIVKVVTRFGEIEVKIGRLGDRIVSRTPEYESCKQAASKAGVSVKEVYEETLRCLASVAEA